MYRESRRKEIFQRPNCVLRYNRSDGDTIEAYKEAAADVQQAETPSRRTGGSLVDEDDLDEITSTAGPPSATGSAS